APAGVGPRGGELRCSIQVIRPVVSWGLDSTSCDREGMMRHRGLLLIAAGLLLAADAPKGDATKKELAKLLSTWRVQSAERDGQALEGFKDMLTTFTKDGKIAVKFPDGSEGAGTYT